MTGSTSGSRDHARLRHLVCLCGLVWLWILPCNFFSCFAVGQELQPAGEPMDSLSELVELQFGVHTSQTGEQSWNVGIKLVAEEGHAHIALHDAEAAILKIADAHIERVLHSQCLTSQEITKLRTAAKVQANHIVRRGEAFRREVEGFPIDGKSNPRLQEQVGRFKRENAGLLFAPLSLFARTLRAIAN